MLKIVKLFIAVLVSMFLAGCGGGGGGSDGGGNGGKSANISFAELEAAFAPFPVPSGVDVGYVERGKIYNVANFNGSILTNNGYMAYDDDNPTDYERDDSSSDITYYVLSDPSRERLEVGIDSYSNFTGLTDDVFNAEFDFINGNLKTVYAFVSYNGNISSQYAKYALSLNNAGFNCSINANAGTGRCTKKSEDNKFTYVWQLEDVYSYTFYIFVD